MAAWHRQRRVLLRVSRAAWRLEQAERERSWALASARGLLLTGGAGGMVNPFNGEGIAYALESGQIAAQVITRALARPHAAATENVLQAYPAALTDAYGGYYPPGPPLPRPLCQSPAPTPVGAPHRA